MKQKPLKAKEVGKLIPGLELSKKDNVVLVEDENKKFITVNKEPYFFYYEDKMVPTLKLLQTKDLLKKITVDMGAIKFVVNGADVMRPGITKIQESIEKNDFIVIVDDENRENEGDLVVAADKVTPSKLNYMIKWAGGFMCLPMVAHRLNELKIPLMVPENTDKFELMAILLYLA